jgi:hypothetical protein
MDTSTLQAHWDSQKNTCSFEEATGSKKYWWKGPCGHSWERTYQKAKQTLICPYCTGRAVLPGYNDLTTTHPTIAEQWHPHKNDPLTPELVSIGSGRKAWWLCDKGHEWEARIASRKTNGCGVCSGHVFQPGVNDLTTTHPEVADQWDDTKNALLANQVTAGSHEKTWWRCKLGHSWKTSVIERTRNGSGCPVCLGKRSDKVPSLLAHQLVEEWHPTKNSILPTEVTPGSGKKVWWQCRRGHEWVAQIAKRTLGSGCPVCARTKRALGNGVTVSDTISLAQYWDSEKNSVPSDEVTAGSKQVFWWRCEQGHEWEDSPLANRSRKNPCPACSNIQIILGVNDILTRYPKLIPYWKQELNPETPLDTLKPGFKPKIKWNCPNGHVWEAKILNMVHSKSANPCPYCLNRRHEEGVNDIATLYPELEKVWHPDNPPMNKSYPGAGELRWKCQKGHEWEATIYSVLAVKDETKCSVCANRVTIPTVNSLLVRDPSLAAQWHPTKNGDVTPDQVALNANIRAWWRCEQGHEWQTYVYVRQQTGCPKCSKRVSEPEKVIEAYLTSLGLKVETQSSSIIPPKQVDLYLPDHNIAIEYNGLYWHSEAAGKDNQYHYNKWKACKDKGIQLIQIWEDDWKRNPELVKNMLAHKLGVSATGKTYARQTTVVELGKQQTREFLALNHIQGNVDGSLRYGLMYRDELVAVIVFKVEPGTNGKTLNLLRFATSRQVVGGFTKLLKHLEKTHPEITEIVTFSDNCVSDGGLYENTGFKAVKQLKPDYSYLVSGERRHKFGYRLSSFRNNPELKYEEGLSEKQLALLNGLTRIWDAGKTKWVKTVG